MKKMTYFKTYKYFIASMMLFTFLIASTNLPKVTEDKIITPDNDVSQSSFGHSVSISGDWMAIGDPYDATLGSSAGAVYLFYKDGDNWVEYEKLTAQDGGENQYFGWAVAIQNSKLAISSPRLSESPTESGSAYLFHLNSYGNWKETLQLQPSDGMSFPEDQFGYSIDLEDSRVIVGAPNAIGSVFVFDITGSISKLKYTIKKIALENDWLILSRFGQSVDLDSDRIAIGANERAYIFSYDKEFDNWTEQAKIFSPDYDKDFEYGSAVSIHNNLMAVGAHGNDEERGSVYIYEYLEGFWEQKTKLISPDGVYNDAFGASVQILDRWLFAGSPLHQNRGAVYLFRKELDGLYENWEKVMASDGQDNDYFGGSLSVNEKHLAIGLSSLICQNNKPCANSRSLYMVDVNDEMNINITSAWFYGDLSNPELIVTSKLDDGQSAQGLTFQLERRVNGQWVFIDAQVAMTDSVPTFRTFLGEPYDIEEFYLYRVISIDSQGLLLTHGVGEAIARPFER